MQLHREEPQLRAAGAGLVFVGNGNATFARAFREEFGITVPVLVDVERRAYEALGLARGALAAIGSLQAVKAGARAWRAGFRQRGLQGDAWQLGGVFVVRPGGEIAYRYASKSAGDHPPVADVLAAVEG